MIKSLLFIILCVFSNHMTGQYVENVVLITLDGLRWQELYGGAVDSMIMSKDLTKDKEDILLKFSAGTKEESRKKLMPWFWSTLVEEGQLYGNRWLGNKMTCTNRFWFSYPGYNEILSGNADVSIDSNEKVYNKNITVLEWLHQKKEFKNKVAAFCSWDVFPYIINDRRSGIYVNAGFDKAEGDNLSQKERWLNELQDQIPSPWSSVRLDAFTHNFMMEYLKKNHPRVVYMSYGETDDFAHDGRYDHYLRSAHQTDQWIKELWEYLQSDPFYKGKTSLIITTDHGRGTTPMTEWKGHGTTTIGSNEIWAAAIGPNVKSLGEVSTDILLFQNQIAQTLANLLGYEFKVKDTVIGEAISTIIEND